MATIQTLARLALVAALTVILAPASAQSQSVGAPLSLLPPAAKAKKQAAPHATAVRKPARRAKASVAAAPRTPVAAPRTPAAVPAASVAAIDHVMGGENSAGLIARLPWWRRDAVNPDEAAMSQVLAAADAWLDARGTEAYASASPAQFANAGDGGSLFVEAGAFNPLDRLAPAPQPANPAWLYSLLAVLGGALAAVAAGLLLVRLVRRRSLVLSAPTEV
jgi:hypothetical protein